MAIGVASVGAATLVTNNTPTALNTSATGSNVVIHTSEGLGSGVRVGDDLIITARHVVGDDATVKVTGEDGKEETADVLWTDAVHDLAAIRSHVTRTQSALSCSVAAVGTHVTVVGNPLGFSFIHTYGYVSSGLLTDKRLNESWKDIIAVEVAGGPGNSGGAVYDDRGRVVGILVGAMVSQVGFLGITFVIPSSTVCAAIQDHAKIALQPNV